MEYDLTVAAGASPDSIAMNFDGADEIMTNAQGELVLKLGAREILQPRPLIYQMVDGTRKEIAGGYKMLNRTQGCLRRREIRPRVAAGD